MIKKASAIFGAYLVVCLLVVISMGRMGEATTALYQVTMRLITSSGFVADNTASATPGSYNQTCQVVDETGTIIDPGTASATAASPNCTIRVVNSTGLVVHSFAGTAAPTSTPTMAVPTATSTAGNVLTESGLGSPSSTTHDMIACCVEQSTSANAFLTAGWFPMATANNWNGGASWLNIMAHCVTPGESGTATFVGLANDRSTGLGCVLIRNTGCGQDVTGTGANTGAGQSTTVTYPGVTPVSANNIILYCATSGAAHAGTTTATNPPGLIVDVTSPAVLSTQGYFQIGHIFQAVPTAVATVTGTITQTDNNAGTVGVVTPLH